MTPDGDIYVHVYLDNYADAQWLKYQEELTHKYKEAIQSKYGSTHFLNASFTGNSRMCR